MYELINNVPLKIKEYNGQRVVTFKDIDIVHNRPEGTVRKRFNDNRKRFIEGENYFKVKCSEMRPFFEQALPNGFNPNADIVLMTESGYLMLVKSFTDDLAWIVQRQLVKSYFRAKALENYINNQSLYTVSDMDTIIERAVNKAVVEAVSETVKVLALYMKNSADHTNAKNKIPCRKRNCNNGKILNLPQDIRRKVDDMIISGEYSCQKIADFIKENTGIEVSYMTVSRYIKKYFILQK